MRMTIFVTLLAALFGASAYAQSVSPVSPGSAAEKALSTDGGAMPGQIKAIAGKRGATLVPLLVDANGGLRTSNIAGPDDATVWEQKTGNTHLSNIEASAAAIQANTAVSPINTTGNAATNALVDNLAVVTLVAPAGAVGFVLQGDIGNSATVRWRQGVDPTTIDGAGLEAGQDTGYVPGGANVRVIAAAGTQTVHINWILQ